MTCTIRDFYRISKKSRYLLEKPQAKPPKRFNKLFFQVVAAFQVKPGGDASELHAAVRGPRSFWVVSLTPLPNTLYWLMYYSFQKDRKGLEFHHQLDKSRVFTLVDLFFDIYNISSLRLSRWHLGLRQPFWHNLLVANQPKLHSSQWCENFPKRAYLRAQDGNHWVIEEVVVGIQVCLHIRVG